jgi:hypothetical protein
VNYNDEDGQEVVKDVVNVVNPYPLTFDRTFDVVPGAHLLEHDVNKRSKSMQLEIGGNSTSRVALHSMQIGWRNREES